MMKHKILLLALAITLCLCVVFLVPPPISGQWRFYIPPFPSSDGAPKWVDLEFSKGDVILLGTDRPTADIGSVVGSYSKRGYRIYSYKDETISGTFRPGWFRATIELNEAPDSYIMLKRIFRAE